MEHYVSVITLQSGYPRANGLGHASVFDPALISGICT